MGSKNIDPIEVGSTMMVTRGWVGWRRWWDTVKKYIIGTREEEWIFKRCTWNKICCDYS
jgi:hypothetical protein